MRHRGGGLNKVSAFLPIAVAVAIAIYLLADLRQGVSPEEPPPVRFAEVSPHSYDDVIDCLRSPEARKRLSEFANLRTYRGASTPLAVFAHPDGSRMVVRPGDGGTIVRVRSDTPLDDPVKEVIVRCVERPNSPQAAPQFW